MRPFNLDDYLKNPERKVVTRDGRDVRIICTDFNNPNYPGICEIKGSKCPYSFATNGELIKGKKLSGDLFFAPEKHEGWINLYKTETSSQYVTSNLYNSEEKAIEIGRNSENYIATIKIEWEE